MTRNGLKVVALAAAVLGLLVALTATAADAFDGRTADLPAAPVARGTAARLPTANDGNLVVDMKDWQNTRIKIGTTSNPKPK